MKNLSDKTCSPCEGGTQPLDRSGIDQYIESISGAWEISNDNTTLERTLSFQNFREAMNIVYETARIAEDEGHHPDIDIRYDKVKLSLSTHAIEGLSENDFILAAKIDKLLESK